LRQKPAPAFIKGNNPAFECCLGIFACVCGLTDFLTFLLVNFFIFYSDQPPPRGFRATLPKTAALGHLTGFFSSGCIFAQSTHILSPTLLPPPIVVHDPTAVSRRPRSAGFVSGLGWFRRDSSPITVEQNPRSHLSSPGPASSFITPNHQSRVYLHLHPGVDQSPTIRSCIRI
jgi:hypothetical protein